MTEKSEATAGLHQVEIREGANGLAEIRIDGKRVRGVTGYRIEQDAAKNRVPVLTMSILCDLTLDTRAIPPLPEPWSWFYQPKVEGFCDSRDASGEREKPMG